VVHFEPKAEKPRAEKPQGQRPTTGESDGRLAPVTYLRGAAPAAAESAAADTESDAADTEWDAADTESDAADTESDAAAEREHAERVLLQRLRGRSLSAAEAHTVLAGTDIAAHEVDEIIERFAELHYIDEDKLAEQIVHSHHERKGLGRSGVQAEMRRRGLDPELILAKLEELPDDETERAIELACKRVTQLERLDDQTIDRRLSGFLMRKGYASSIVRVAVKAALASRSSSGASGSGATSRVRFR
jgi:regulatory protein